MRSFFGAALSILVVLAAKDAASERPPPSSCLASPLGARTARVTCPFGRVTRAHPDRPHLGIDLAVKAGTRVRAATDGVVTFAGAREDGTYVVETEFAPDCRWGAVHLKRIDVRVGDQLSRGQVVGLSGGVRGAVGSGSKSTGPHLHFYLKCGDRMINPESRFCRPIRPKQRRRQ